MFFSFFSPLQDALISAHSIERGFLILQPVSIGKGCVVGMHTVIMPQCALDNGVTLAPMSMVPVGTALPLNTNWEGSPVHPKVAPLLAVPAAEKKDAGKKGKFVSWTDEAKVVGDPVPSTRLRTMKLRGLALTLALTWVALLPMASWTLSLWKVRQPITRNMYIWRQQDT